MSFEKISAYISNPAAIQSLFLNLFLYARFSCVIGILILKALSAFVAVITLSSVFTATIFNQVGGTAMPTSDFDMLFHDD